MTDPFDPDKVKFYDPGQYGKYKYAVKEDFDALLSLYRTLQAENASLRRLFSEEITY